MASATRRKSPETVQGITAPSVRLTTFGAALLALAVALPAGAVIGLIDWLL
jgi:hypothetical protein